MIGCIYTSVCYSWVDPVLLWGPPSWMINICNIHTLCMDICINSDMICMDVYTHVCVRHAVHRFLPCWPPSWISNMLYMYTKCMNMYDFYGCIYTCVCFSRVLSFYCAVPQVG